MDDGILHAYIDGALDALGDAGELPDGMTAADVGVHLSQCADCRARLEVERDIRERAGLVLRDTAPPRVEAPPFATIEQARRAPRRMVPMAWAATVLLAVGAGWWGNGLWRAQGPEVPMSQESAADATAADGEVQRIEPPALSDAQSGSAAASPDATTSSAGAATSAPMLAEVAPSAAAPGRSLAESATSTAMPERAGAPPPSSDAAAIAGARGVSPDRPEERAEAANAARARAPGADTVLSAQSVPLLATQTDSALRRDRIALDSGRRGFAPITARASADAQTLQSSMRLFDDGRAGSDAPYSFVIAAAEDVRAFESVLAREQAGRLHWRGATAADLASAANQLLIVAAGTEPVIEIAQEIGQTTLRARQSLATGEEIELITWRIRTLHLEEIVITGAASGAARDTLAATRERRAEAAQAPAVTRAAEQERASKVITGDSAGARFALSPAEPRTLADGRRELVLRAIPSGTWIAIRAHLEPGELRRLAGTLTTRSDLPR